MQKILLSILGVFFATVLVAQGNGKTVTLTCKFTGVPENIDSISLYEPYGITSKPIAKSAKRASDGAYVFTVPASKPKFYALGIHHATVARVVLGEEKEVTIWANFEYLNKARCVGSTVNKQYEDLKKRVDALRGESEQLRAQYTVANGTAKTMAADKLKDLGKRKQVWLDSLKSVNNFLWRTATLSIIPDYAGQTYGTESEFVANSFFQYANLTDKEYEQHPDVFFAFENYAKTLALMGLDSKLIKQYFDTQMAKLTPGSKVYRMGLGGLYSGLKTTNNPLFPEYGAKYLDLYKNASYGEIATIDFEVKKSATFTPGFEAPDLVGYTPDSTLYSLNKLRGKIVLIDFWASWCGPCRKENPNVVVNYNKYKDRGFDILGVSLDKDKGAWEKAIAADGLPWHHISDLKGWQSQHAALYSVTSIPQTILLDRQGKIIARNLRGEQLGQKLKDLLGE